jgi:hypothetical protein
MNKLKLVLKSLLQLVLVYVLILFLVKAAHGDKVHYYFWSFWIAFLVCGSYDLGKQKSSTKL